MQLRAERHHKILELISKQQIGTQLDLRDALTRSGFHVNQATLSRDIRELELVKIVTGGRYRYASRERLSAPTTKQASLTSVKQVVHNIDWSGNTIVVKTASGAAGHVAEAIDGLSLKDILGTVAGDNTIFLVVRRQTDASKLAQQLRKLLG